MNRGLTAGKAVSIRGEPTGWCAVYGNRIYSGVACAEEGRKMTIRIPSHADVRKFFIYDNSYLPGDPFTNVF